MADEGTGLTGVVVEGGLVSSTRVGGGHQGRLEETSLAARGGSVGNSKACRKMKSSGKATGSLAEAVRRRSAQVGGYSKSLNSVVDGWKVSERKGASLHLQLHFAPIW